MLELCLWAFTQLVYCQVTGMTSIDSEEIVDADDDVIKIDQFLDDDTFMSIAFEWGSPTLLWLA